MTSLEYILKFIEPHIQIMSILNIMVCVKLPQISFTPFKNVTSYMDEPQKKIDVFIIRQSA